MRCHNTVFHGEIETFSEYSSNFHLIWASIHSKSTVGLKSLIICTMHLHTCDIFLEPDREIWDFSKEGWGLRKEDFCAVKIFHISVKNWHILHS